MKEQEQLQQWTNMIKDKFGLGEYTRYSAVTGYEKNDWNKTDYRFTTEWLPPGIAERTEADLNPKGTAIVELDAKTGRLKNAVFVGGKAPVRGLSFLTGDKPEIIQWIEQETGWAYGEQFIDADSKEHSFSFQLAYKGTPVFPEGRIHVSVDDQKKLIFFSVYGHVPEQVEEADFQLTLESIEPIARERLEFVEIPFEKTKKWIPAYIIDEQFINNKTGKPLQENQEILKWTTAKNKKIKRKLVHLAPDELEENQLFDFPEHPDTKAITKKGYKKIREASLDFLQSYAPKESGEWALSHIKRSSGVIEARLTNIKDTSAVPRTWKLLLDKESYEVISYQDNSWMLGQFDEYEKAVKPVLSKSEAFEKIRPHLELKPVYVYDGEFCRLHGQFVSKAAVHAASGETIIF